MVAGPTRLATALDVTLAVERGFALRRHFVAGRVGPVAPARVAASVAGLHAARLSSPWVAMRARSPRFEPAELRRPLLKERSLVKLRCMRRTLHILPLPLAATAHAATLDQRLPPCLLALRRLGHSERALSRAAAAVRDALAGNTVAYRELERAVTKRGPGRAELARLAIKWLWERGEIVYLDLSPSLHHERRAFALTGGAYPRLDLQAESCARAQEELVLTHIRAFGPASVRDIAWWSGIGTSRVRAVLALRADELARVRVRGLTPELYVHAGDVDGLRAAEPVARDELALLSYEDPSLKGYFDTRSRYVADNGYRLLFNSIGEARASIVRGGKVVGVWTWNRRVRRIESHLFAPLPKRLARHLGERLHDMEGFLRAEPVLT